MKILTFGCSYSQVASTTIETKYSWTWPVFLDIALNKGPVNTENHQGSGATGNELISRKVIHYVDQALKSHNAEDLLVGIMWSGCDRHSVVLQESKRQFDKTYKLPLHLIDNDTSYEDFNNNLFQPHQRHQAAPPDKGEKYKLRNHMFLTKQYYCNPQRLTTNEFNYISMTPYWDDKLSTVYYENFADPLGSLIKTCEHILRTQWYLKLHNIKYFMCAYDFDTFMYAGIPAQRKDLYTTDCPALSLQAQNDLNSRFNYLEHPDVKYLYTMIDQNYWLSADSLGEWCRYVSEFDFPSSTDPHPGWEQHEDFVNKVILPFLMQKYNISCYNA